MNKAHYVSSGVAGIVIFSKLSPFHVDKREEGEDLRWSAIRTNVNYWWKVGSLSCWAVELYDYGRNLLILWNCCKRQSRLNVEEFPIVLLTNKRWKVMVIGVVRKFVPSDERISNGWRNLRNRRYQMRWMNGRWWMEVYHHRESTNPIGCGIGRRCSKAMVCWSVGMT